MKPMIASKNRVILILMAAGVLILTVSLFLLRKTPQKPDQTYAEGVNNYAAQLKDNGLIAVKQISQSDGGEAFITMLVPGTGEVTDQDVEQLTELLIFTAQVFENRGGIRSGDIAITFQRPMSQQIIFVSRPDGLPDPLGLMGEMTIASPDQPGFVLSIVNLAGTPKTLGRAPLHGPQIKLYVWDTPRKIRTQIQFVTQFPPTAPPAGLALIAAWQRTGSIPGDRQVLRTWEAMITNSDLLTSCTMSLSENDTVVYRYNCFGRRVGCLPLSTTCRTLLLAVVVEQWL